MTFDELYQAHFEQIFKFCYRYVGDDDLAGDLCQDTFIKLYQRMTSSNKQIENPRAWLYKVATNLCLNSNKVSQRRNTIKSNLPVTGIEVETPETVLLAKESADTLRDLLYRLKPENRMLLLLYQDGLSYQEMSDATGIPLNSVGKTLWRSIAKLSEIVKTSKHGS